MPEQVERIVAESEDSEGVLARRGELMPDKRSKFNIRMRMAKPVDDDERDKSKPLAFDDFLTVKLDDQEREKLGKEITDWITAILEERKDLEKRIQTYRNQYDQILADSGQPWPGAYHLNVPITADKMDTAVAETIQIFEESEPKWTIQGPPNEDVEDAVGLQQETLDIYENLMRFGTSPKIYFDAFLLGNGWERRIFKREIVPSIEKRTWSSTAEFIEDFPDDWEDFKDVIKALNDGHEVTRIVELDQELQKGPYSEHVEWEDAIVPLATDGIKGMQLAPITGCRVWMKHWEIRQWEEKGDYLEGTADKLKFHYKLRSDGFTERGPFNEDFEKEPFETFEVMYWMNVPIDGKKQRVRCLVNVEQKSKLVMRVIRYPYSHNRPYLIPHCIQKSRHGIYQPGLGEKLQELNLGLNALLSHILNSGTLATTLSLKAKDDTSVLKRLYEFEWYPGSILRLMNLDDVQQLQFNLPDLRMMIEIFSLLMTFADSVSGMNPSLSGEVDPADPNAPGNKTGMLLRKSEKKLRLYITNLKESVNESGYQSLRLIAQFIPPGEIAQLLGRQESEVKQLMRIPLPAVVHATAFDIDRYIQQAEDRQWMAVLMADPIFQQDVPRRIKLYKEVAEMSSSVWQKRLKEILPTEEELKAMESPGAPQGNEAEAMFQRARQKALEAGKTEEEADEIATQTVDAAAQMAQGGAPA